VKPGTSAIGKYLPVLGSIAPNVPVPDSQTQIRPAGVPAWRVGHGQPAGEHLARCHVHHDAAAGLIAPLCITHSRATSFPRSVLRHLLELEGWTVREAVNGRAGLDQLAEDTPGLILLDLMMPEMDGFEFVAKLQKTHEWRSLPVVVVTAKDITEEDLLRLRGYTHRVLRKDASNFDKLLKDLG
jgi:CheY-like chemotaxis protein